MNAGLIKNTALANKPRIRKMSKKKELFNFNKVMVLLLIIAVFAIIKSAIAPQASSLEQDADIAIAKLTGGHEEIGLLSSNEIDTEKLVMLEKMDYNEVKGMLGVKNDFCIYFEDEDGNLAKIANINPGIGSAKVYINGKPCR